MNNYKIYQDSKEIPLWNYKRIVQTEDFFYMVKGYESGDSVELNIDELKVKFHEIEQESIISLNEKNADFALYGKLERLKLELSMFLVLDEVIKLKIQEKNLCDKLEIDFDRTIIEEMLSKFKIPKKENLSEQSEIVKQKITKYENDLEEVLSKVKKPKENPEEFDIDEQIINVKIGLEVDFDERKTSLYQYQIYIKALVRKIEQIDKINRK
ncbi:hypothetical protein ATE47_04195 [Chryseobacterium sp. IHB B 17019]|uniref:hypothetical protein n=1 Tax=Chryseobacterium sp. IHB B 17019 TaxID=1721091 RepID=UPI00072275A5|nr:hypothetical protein [Chryseobacterium sp. IHB B 17019]ALR29770.1 hypothetical protein ATE47_04195 [Chryseobacterium sp. IHB B 17019]